MNVPMLVMRANQQLCPIIGFNVTEHVVIESQKKQPHDAGEERLLNTVMIVVPSLKTGSVKAFIKAVLC